MESAHTDLSPALMSPSVASRDTPVALRLRPSTHPWLSSTTPHSHPTPESTPFHSVCSRVRVRSPTLTPTRPSLTLLSSRSRSRKLLRPVMLRLMSSAIRTTCSFPREAWLLVISCKFSQTIWPTKKSFFIKRTPHTQPCPASVLVSTVHSLSWPSKVKPTKCSKQIVPEKLMSFHHPSSHILLSPAVSSAATHREKCALPTPSHSSPHARWMSSMMCLP